MKSALAACLLLVVACGSEEGDAGDDPTPRAVAIEGRPAAIAAGGEALWLVDDERDEARRVGTDGAFVGPAVAIAPQPVAVDVDAASGTVWIAHASGVVTRLRSDGSPLGDPTDLGGTLVDVVADGHRAWVGDIETGTVVAVDADTGAAGEPIAVPAGVVRLALDGDRLWVTNLEHTVTAIDLDRLEVDDPVEVGFGPIGLDVADGVVWVANSDDDTVSRLDAATGEALGDGPIAVGDAPVAVEVVGPDVWVLNQDGASVSRLDRDGSPQGVVVDLGTRPRGFAFFDGSLWAVGVEPSTLVAVAASAAG